MEYNPGAPSHALGTVMPQSSEMVCVVARSLLQSAVATETLLLWLRMLLLSLPGLHGNQLTRPRWRLQDRDREHRQRPELAPCDPWRNSCRLDEPRRRPRWCVFVLVDDPRLLVQVCLPRTALRPCVVPTSILRPADRQIPIALKIVPCIASYCVVLYVVLYIVLTIAHRMY